MERRPYMFSNIIELIKKDNDSVKESVIATPLDTDNTTSIGKLQVDLTELRKIYKKIETTQM